MVFLLLDDFYFFFVVVVAVVVCITAYIYTQTHTHLEVHRLFCSTKKKKEPMYIVQMAAFHHVSLFFFCFFITTCAFFLFLFFLRLLWISGASWLYFCVRVFVALCFLIRIFSLLSLSSSPPLLPLSTTEVVLMWSAAVVNDMFAYLYEICLVSARPSFFSVFFSSPLRCVKRNRGKKKEAPLRKILWQRTGERKCPSSARI